MGVEPERETAVSSTNTSATAASVGSTISGVMVSVGGGNVGATDSSLPQPMSNNKTIMLTTNKCDFIPVSPRKKGLKKRGLLDFPILILYLQNFLPHVTTCCLQRATLFHTTNRQAANNIFLQRQIYERNWERYQYRHRRKIRPRHRTRILPRHIPQRHCQRKITWIGQELP